MNKLIKTFILVMPIFMAVSCSWIEEPDLVEPPTVLDKLEAGWAAYHSSSQYLKDDGGEDVYFLDSAQVAFTQALSRDVNELEAIQGMIFTLSRKGKFEESLAFLNLYKSSVTATDYEDLAVLNAGYLAVYSNASISEDSPFKDIDVDSLAIQYGLALVQLVDDHLDSAFTYSHDSSISLDNSKRTIAQKYFHVEDLYNAHKWIMELESSFPNLADVTSKTDTLSSAFFTFNENLLNSFKSGQTDSLGIWEIYGVNLGLVTDANNLISIESVENTAGTVSFSVLGIRGMTSSSGTDILLNDIIEVTVGPDETLEGVLAQTDIVVTYTAYNGLFADYITDLADAISGIY